mmetsp:Transcript_67395/g.154393  ORF Transcript_67395/g.154393 Transcript_67395/m.154393 type:complete len:400 (+) Transcript_67395:1094-2293(+)
MRGLPAPLDLGAVEFSKINLLYKVQVFVHGLHSPTARAPVPHPDNHLVPTLHSKCKSGVQGGLGGRGGVQRQVHQVHHILPGPGMVDNHPPHEHVVPQGERRGVPGRQPPSPFQRQQLHCEPRVGVDSGAMFANSLEGLLKRDLLQPHQIGQHHRSAPAHPLDTVDYDMASSKDGIMDPHQCLVQYPIHALHSGVPQVPGQELEAAVPRQRAAGLRGGVHDVGHTLPDERPNIASHRCRTDAEPGDHSAQPLAVHRDQLLAGRGPGPGDRILLKRKRQVGHALRCARFPRRQVLPAVAVQQQLLPPPPQRRAARGGGAASAGAAKEWGHSLEGPTPPRLGVGHLEHRSVRDAPFGWRRLRPTLPLFTRGIRQFQIRRALPSGARRWHGPRSHGGGSSKT